MGDSWIVWKQSKNLGRYMFFSPFSPTCFSFFGYTYDWQQKEFFYQNVTRFKQWFGKGERLQPQPNIKHHEEKVIHWILWDYQKECTLNCYHLMQQSELKPTISNLSVWTKLWGKKTCSGELKRGDGQCMIIPHQKSRHKRSMNLGGRKFFIHLILLTFLL